MKRIKSGDVTDGSLLAQDFKAGQLAAGPRGATGPQGPAGAQFNEAAAGGDLAGTYPNPSIGSNAVNSDKVADGSLTTADVTKEAGTTTYDQGSTAAHTCAESGVVFLAGGAESADNDPIVLTPNSAWSTVGTSFTYHTRHVGGAHNGFRIMLCNLSAAAVDPPSIDFHWAVLNRP